VDGLAFPWQVKVSPDGQHVYATGRSDNAISVFNRDPVTGRLTFREQQKDGVNGVDGLAGANSLSFSANGDFVYATGRTDNAIAVFSRNATTGALTFLEVHRDGVNGVDGLAGASGIKVSQSDDAVYVTGRSDNAIAIFSRNPVSGRLTFAGLKRDGVGGMEPTIWKPHPMVSISMRLAFLRMQFRPSV
jgi:6-phosphogluconolactonase (cycloisomerase 2 family)